MVGNRSWLDTPPPARMTLVEWQTRLTSTFNAEGVIGGTNLLPVFKAERGYGATVDSHFRGYRVLSGSLQNFWFQTLRLAEEKWRRGGANSSNEWYGIALLEYAGLFRVIRSSDILLHSGYPLDGFSLLRDVRDRAVCLAAVGKGLTSHRLLFGYDATESPPKTMTQEEWEACKRRAENTERDALRKMIGSESGLDAATIAELKGWTELFHMEVHRSRLTRSAEFKEWMTGIHALPLIPQPRELPLAMFVNRFVEVAWMVLRVLPLLQLSPHSFGAKWSRRWEVLDASFRHDVEDVWRLRKPIAGAVICMIDAKFAFSPESTYAD